MSKPPSTAARVVSLVVRSVVGVGILVVAIGVAGTLVATRPSPPRANRPEPVLQVRVMPATSAQVARVWTGYGTARAMNAAQIPAQVSGVAVERPTRIETGMAVPAVEPPVDPAMDPVPGPDSSPGSDPTAERPEDRVGGRAYLDWLRAAAGEGLIVQIDPSDYIARLDSALDQIAATRAQIASLGVQEARVREQVALATREREVQERELGRLEEAQSAGGANVSEIERRRSTLFLAQRVEAQLLEQYEQIEPRRTELRARLRDQAAVARIARENLGRTVITSPIAGSLQEVMVEQGEWVQSGAPVARVVDLSRVEVPLRVPMSAAGSIRVGDGVTLRADVRADLSWEGRVARLAPEGDAGTRTLTVFVEVRQDPGGDADLLRPGQFVVGDVRTQRLERVLLVPRRVIADDRLYIAVESEAAEGGTIMVARSVHATPLFAVVGQRPDLDPLETEWIALARGGQLGEGDRVIVTNIDDLHEGLVVGVAGADASARSNQAAAGGSRAGGAGGPEDERASP
ncbi:MAG: HlyD family efflux transporter periplasmic adaptor subunit [Phycisphaerales bacterium]|nr:HlyD family efflux transporter periplasmic adaptor subunit [Phycisphaerales bacterium]MCB9840611.1 HlyD family efflux transporter periplasmic adaptor subunit [Phycisphaeraceae bacterium]